MKTTVELDDELLDRAKRFAAAQGRTLKSVIEDALRALLLPQPARSKRYRIDLPVDRGETLADVADRRTLYDTMEDR